MKALRVQHHFEESLEGLLKVFSPPFDASTIRYVRLVKYQDVDGVSDMIYALYRFGLAAPKDRYICIYSTDDPYETSEYVAKSMQKWCDAEHVELISHEHDGVFVFEIHDPPFIQ